MKPWSCSLVLLFASPVFAGGQAPRAAVVPGLDVFAQIVEGTESTNDLVLACRRMARPLDGRLVATCTGREEGGLNEGSPGELGRVRREFLSFVETRRRDYGEENQFGLYRAFMSLWGGRFWRAHQWKRQVEAAEKRRNEGGIDDFPALYSRIWSISPDTPFLSSEIVMQSLSFPVDAAAVANAGIPGNKADISAFERVFAALPVPGSDPAFDESLAFVEASFDGQNENTRIRLELSGEQAVDFLHGLSGRGCKKSDRLAFLSFFSRNVSSMSAVAQREALFVATALWSVHPFLVFRPDDCEECRKQDGMADFSSFLRWLAGKSPHPDVREMARRLLSFENAK